MAAAGTQAADAVAQVDAIAAAGTAHRPVMHCEYRGIAAAERHDLGARLHARPLFGEHEFAAGKIIARLRQQHHDLQREDVLDYFKKEGTGYQRRINAVLRSYMQQKRKKRA